jgi:hypothetical protein
VKYPFVLLLKKHQQKLKGMTASSVPVRNDVPGLMEDLNTGGIRFVYFSPRNMKRTKLLAEKIGINFDWNCAISLRDLSEEQTKDPHRHISNYADWDVLGFLLLFYYYYYFIIIIIF